MSSGRHPGVILKLSWSHPEVVLKLSWSHPEVVLSHPEVVLSHPEGALGVSWSCPELVLKLSWSCPEVILKSSWSHPEVVLKSSWGRPEVVLKSSWSHHEESEAKRLRLWALEHLSSDIQTDRQTDRQTKISIYWAPVGAKNNITSIPSLMFKQTCSSEIKTVMSNLGVHFTDDEIQEMMIEVREHIQDCRTVTLFWLIL